MKCSCVTERPGGCLETLRKHRSVETRWANSFLSPEEPRWEFRGRESRAGNADFRWELHTSQTDVDIARSSRSKCTCPRGSFASDADRRPVERGDLRKHHSAETDKWTLHPDAAAPRHHLRKHNSDDTRMARDARWTLQVPEVLPNPGNTRCTCSKAKRRSLSPANDFSSPEHHEHSASWIYHARSASPEVKASKKNAESTTTMIKTAKSPDARAKSAGRELRRQTRVESQTTSKRWDLREQADEPGADGGCGKLALQQFRFAGKTHLSLPLLERGSSWLGAQKSLGDAAAAKICKNKQKPISPESGRQLFPEIAVTDEPASGVRTAKVEPTLRSPRDERPKDSWCSFGPVTPTSFPPPMQTLTEPDDDARWTFLNRVSPFPIYQGAWKEHPSPSPALEPCTTVRRAKSEEAKSRSRQRPQLIRSKALLEVPAVEHHAKRSLSEEVPRYRMQTETATRGPNRARSEEGPKYGDPWFANSIVVESTEMCEYVTTV